MSPLYWQEVQPVDSSPGRLPTSLALIQPFAELLPRRISERTSTIPGESYFGKTILFPIVFLYIFDIPCVYSTIDFRWLNDPQFVGSFETEDHVYFLFRESAVEYINCGKVIRASSTTIFSLTCVRLILKDRLF